MCTACSSSNKKWRTLEGSVWNTLFTVKYESEYNLEDSVYRMFECIDNSLSVFNRESIVSLVNSSDSVEIDEHFNTVFETSKKISSYSHGRFDPTVGRLIDLWGFGKDKSENSKTLPDDEKIKKELENVGIINCRIEKGHLIKKNKLTTFNFSSLAKGYGCDLIGDMFKRNGVENYMIEIGGEINLKGHNIYGKEWVIQIDSPFFTDNDNFRSEPLLKIRTTDCAIATSGNYRNNRETSIGKLGHIIDPVTGYPSSNNMLSVTIIAADAVTADAIATACMLMNKEEAQKMVFEIGGISALFVVETNEDGYDIIKTPHFPSTID